MDGRIRAIIARLCCSGTRDDEEDEQEHDGGVIRDTGGEVTGHGGQSDGEQGDSHAEGSTAIPQYTPQKAGKGKAKDALSPNELAELSASVNKSNVVNPRISRIYPRPTVPARDLDEVKVIFHLVRHGQVLLPSPHELLEYCLTVYDTILTPSFYPPTS